MEEIWNDVPGYNGMYQVSISTKECSCRSMNYNHTGKVHCMANTYSERDRRIYWGLWNGTKQVRQQAAVFVAMTYPELVQNEWFPGAEIDHIDADRLNNHPSNLRWVTHIENIKNPISVENNKNSHKGVFVNHPKLSKPVTQYALDGSFVANYPSIAEASRVTNINKADISGCCLKRKGKYTAGGFKWEYSQNSQRLSS